MKTSYKKDLKRAYFILEEDEIKPEDYQVAMLRQNSIPRILKLEVRYVDNHSHYYYDITGKTSFQTLHEKIPLYCADMRQLVTEILTTIQELSCYMLDGSCLLLEPEYIFCDKEGYYFCYYPMTMQSMEGGCKQADARASFHRLTEFFVREVNYQDEEGVRFAYTLHKATMEENYSIEHIMKNICQEQEKEEETPILCDYEERVDDFSEKGNIIEEKNPFWEPVRRLLERTRKRNLPDPSIDL